MHLLSAFILTVFRVSAYVFKNVIKGEIMVESIT